VWCERLTDRFDLRRRSSMRWAAGAVALTAVLTAAPVLVTSQASAAKKLTVADAAKKVETLRDEAEQATESYNAQREQLKSLNVRLAAAQDRLTAQQERVAAARLSLGRVLAETYKQGELEGLALFLSDDPDAALEQTGVVATLGDRRVTAVQRLRTEEATLAAAKDDLVRQQARIAQTTSSLQKLKDRVQARLADAQKQLAQLQARDRAAVEQVLNGGDTGITCEQVGLDFSGRAGKVLRYACDQLGEPYVWAAAGPGSFDCSGLTMRAWQAAGVSLPHNADAQSHFGTRVAPTEAALRPGDLVFFHRPISHVGIYLGHGLFLHAPHTGTVVKIAQLPLASVVAAARY
jgi:cell wall-associated NlpC family hydrolase